jgi:hypothetical protein
MHKKQEHHQHDQNKKRQFGVSGAHGFNSTFPGNCRKSGIRFIRCRIRPAGKNHGNPVQIGAFLLVPLHTLENIGEQSCWKEHNGTVYPPQDRPGPFLLAFQALKEAWRKPSAPDAGFLHLFI